MKELTPRQLQLVELLASDHSIKEAAGLMLPPLTVHSAAEYLSSARKRLGVRTNFALVRQLAILKQGT